MDHQANDNLMVSLDGWNIQEKKVHIMCGTYIQLWLELPSNIYRYY